AVAAYRLGRFLRWRGLGGVEGLLDAPEIAASGRKVMLTARTDGDLTLLLDGHADDERVIARLAEQDAHVLPPITWRRGEAQVSLLVDDSIDLADLQAQFPEARLLSKRATKNRSRVALASPLFLPDITE